MLVQVHAALFPNVRLLAVSEQSTRSATLTVAVTHPDTNAFELCQNMKGTTFQLREYPRSGSKERKKEERRAKVSYYNGQYMYA